MSVTSLWVTPQQRHTWQKRVTVTFGIRHNAMWRFRLGSQHSLEYKKKNLLLFLFVCLFLWWKTIKASQKNQLQSIRVHSRYRRVDKVTGQRSFVFSCFQHALLPRSTPPPPVSYAFYFHFPSQSQNSEQVMEGTLSEEKHACVMEVGGGWCSHFYVWLELIQLNNPESIQNSPALHATSSSVSDWNWSW